MVGPRSTDDNKGLICGKEPVFVGKAHSTKSYSEIDDQLESYNENGYDEYIKETTTPSGCSLKATQWSSIHTMYFLYLQ